MGWLFSKGAHKSGKEQETATWADLYGNSFREGYSVAPVDDDIDYTRPDDSHLKPKAPAVRKRSVWSIPGASKEQAASPQESKGGGVSKTSLGLAGAAVISVLLSPLWCVFPCLAAPAVAGGGVAAYKAHRFVKTRGN